MGKYWSSTEYDSWLFEQMERATDDYTPAYKEEDPCAEDLQMERELMND